MSFPPRGRPPTAPAPTLPISEQPSQAVSLPPAAAITWIAVARLTIPGDPAQSAEARRWLTKFLQDHLGARAAADDAVLVLSELVANALRHSRSADPGGKIAILAAVRPGTLRLEVTDEGGTWTPSPEALVSMADEETGERGRGLKIVAVLARRWAITGDPSSWTVWAEFGGTAR